MTAASIRDPPSFESTERRSADQSQRDQRDGSEGSEHVSTFRKRPLGFMRSSSNENCRQRWRPIATVGTIGQF